MDENVVGNAFGDQKTAATGSAREATGYAQQSYGQTLDTIRDTVTAHPITSIVLASAVAYLLGRRSVYR